MAEPGRDLSKELFSDAPSGGRDMSADLFGGPSAPVDDFKPTQYGFKVRPISIGNVQTVQREDGAAYFGPEQGNKGAAGWFNERGERMPDDLSAKPEWLQHPIARLKADIGQANRAAANEMAAKAQAQRNMPLLGQIVPAPVAGMTKGFIDTVVAPAQLATRAMGSSAMDPAVNALQQNYEQNWQPSAVGEAMGQALPFVMTAGASAPAVAPKVLTTAERVRAALATIGKAGATGAAVAPAVTPEANVQSEGDFWQRKLEKARMGGALGLTLGGAGQIGGAIASKLKAPLSAEAQTVQNLGDQFRVRTLAPDLTASPGLGKAAVLAEQVPGSGMVAQRLAQQAEAKAAAQKLLDRYGVEGEIPATIQQGLKNKFGQVAQVKNALYDEVAGAAGPRKLGLPKTFDALQEATKDAQASGLPENSVQKTVDTLRSRLYQGRDESGRLIPPQADTTFTGMQKTRSDLNDEITKLYKSGDDKGARILRGVKDAVNQDMQDFATKSGDTALAEKWAQADSFYRKQYIPLKDKVLQGAMKNSEPDQIYKSIIAAGPDRAQKFYSALDSEGQAAVRSQMVKDAFEKATERDGVFSPAKFAQSLEKVKDASGVFFKGQDKFELDGFTNLMRHIQRAGQVAENPPTGQRLILTMLAGEGAGTIGRIAGHGPEAGVAALVTGGTALASARAMTKLFSSQAGKRLLLSASTLKAGTPAMERLIEKDLPRLLAPSTARNIQPLQTLPKAAGEGNPDIAQH